MFIGNFIREIIFWNSFCFDYPLVTRIHYLAVFMRILLAYGAQPVEFAKSQTVDKARTRRLHEFVETERFRIGIRVCGLNRYPILGNFRQFSNYSSGF